MKRVIVHIIYLLGVFFAIASILGAVLLVWNVSFALVAAEAEVDFSELIGLALRSAILIIPSYTLAVLILIPVVRFGGIEQAKRLRNIILFASMPVVLMFPIGTVIALITIMSIYLARGKFSA